MKINGTPSNIFDNCVDSDYKSLYPSGMRQFNMFPHTQIGFIIIAAHIHNKQNKNHYQYYTAGGQFCEDLQCQNYLEFAERWFGLLGFRDLCDYINELFTTEIKPRVPLAHLKVKTEDGGYYPFTQYGKYYFPLYQKINPNTGDYKPFNICESMTPELQDQLKEWKENVAVTPNQSF